MGLRLGAFDLWAPIGWGGMAEVWRGIHPEQNVPVAVKLLTGDLAREPPFVEAFRNEVRAVAGLDHPNVVAVLDHGLAPPEAEEASDGMIVAGSPYLVMEWASGGTLASARPSSWPEVRAILVALLDALAHAHARGVIHRDLKPGNVLRATTADRRPGLKLADFGLAGGAETSPLGDHSLVGGTAAYMAPEQAMGHWREQGPWTDLYAFGCCVHRLVSGLAPYQGTLAEILAAQLHGEPPPLVARFPVPEGFAEWVDVLLARDPARRWRLAADAAWALASLSDPSEPAGASVPPDLTLDEEHQPTLAWIDATRTEVAASGAWAASSDARSGAPEIVSRPAPAMPESWRRPDLPSRRPMDLVGAGLGLYGVRAVPLVGRERERDAVWDALREVHRDREARIVLLEGPSGCGKTRLATWLGERALEVGAASPLRATHGPAPSATDGLGPMLAAYLRCSDGDTDVVPSLVEQELRARGATDEDEWRALAAILAPAGTERSGRGGGVRLQTARERHEAIRRALGRLADERPLIVTVDDAHFGADALEFLLHVAGADRTGSPVLFLAAARSETLAVREVEGDLWRELRGREGVGHLRIDALPREEWPALVRGLLGLDGELALAVEERAAGNPAFAIQLVGDWVDRGILRPGAQGFVLGPGARVQLPADMAAVWNARVEEVFAGRTAAEAVALEIAATLGMTFEALEWADACALAGTRAAAGLVNALSDRCLVRAHGRGASAGWELLHAGFRETILRRASAAGRLAAHHEVCARMLAQRGEAELSERLGLHWLAAGRPENAADPLLAAAGSRGSAGDPRHALALLADCERALTAIEAPPHDARWAEIAIERASAENLRGRLDEALAGARQAEAQARRHGWTRVLSRALVEQARAEHRRGEWDAARTHASEARDVAPDEASRARAEHWLAVIEFEGGDAKAALDHAGRARAAFERIGDGPGVASALYEMGLALTRLGDRPAALELVRHALGEYRRQGIRNGAANALNALGEFARLAHDEAEEERCYREALAIQRAIGSGNALVTGLNLGALLARRHDWGEARSLLVETLEGVERAGWVGLVAGTHAALLACHAAARDWTAWDQALEKVERLTAEHGIVEQDLGTALQLAAAEAQSAGEGARAARALDAAATQSVAP